MDSKELKKTFGIIAKSHGFSCAFGGCYKQSSESIVTLSFQKSNFGNYAYLNIKIYIQNVFNMEYVPNKDLMKKDVGHIFLRPPSRYDIAFDFDEKVSDEKRLQILTELFDNFLIPFTNKALSISGIKELADKREIDLLPAIQEELNI